MTRADPMSRAEPTTRDEPTTGGDGRPRRPDDAGITMIEVVTATALMSVLMTIFTTAMLQVYHFTNRSEAVADARAQVHTVFLRLDKEIRYASGISEPATFGADHYVEYLIARTPEGADDEVPTCVELRLLGAARQLQVREWPKDGSPDTGWRVLASGVSSAQPFTVPADTTIMYQRLTVDLTAESGSGRSASSARLTTTFTALNASIDTPNSAICTEGRPAPP